MDEAVGVVELEINATAGPTPAVADFVAGGIGGACGVVAGQPLDLVRIRQQQPGAAGGGIASFLRGILRAEGARALLRGMSYPLATCTLQNAVVFHAYGAAGRWLAGPRGAVDGSGQPLLALSQVFWAGCAAGVVQTAIIVPVDLLKIRLQLQVATRGAPGYVGPLALLRSVLRAEGLPGLYRGTAVTCIRDFPSHGVYFGVYEAYRELLEPGSRARGQSSLWALWAAGGLAGVVSWLSVYPFDVVKTRLQAAAAAQSPYKGWLDCARQSCAAEGAGVFFRGMRATLLRSFVVNGALFSSYELSHELLTSRGRQAEQAQQVQQQQRRQQQQHQQQPPPA